jgi:hypothetical protein
MQHFIRGSILNIYKVKAARIGLIFKDKNNFSFNKAKMTVLNLMTHNKNKRKIRKSINTNNLTNYLLKN